MRRTCRYMRAWVQALLGVAPAALLTGAPTGALADAVEASVADAAPAFEDVSTGREDAGGGEAAVDAALPGADAPSDATITDEVSDATAPATDASASSENTAADGIDNSVVQDPSAASETAELPVGTEDAEAPVDIADAAVRQDAGAASDDPAAQVQALGIATDPSQVEGYDPAADEEPAQDADAPTGYDASAAASDGGISAQSDSSVRVGDWSYRADEVDGQTVYVIDGYYGSASSVTLPATIGGKQMYSVV